MSAKPVNLGLFPKEPELRTLDPGDAFVFTKAPTSPSLTLTVWAPSWVLPSHDAGAVGHPHVHTVTWLPGSAFSRPGSWVLPAPCHSREGLSVCGDAWSNPLTVCGLLSSCPSRGEALDPSLRPCQGVGSQPLLLIGVFSLHFSSCLIQSLSQLILSFLSPPFPWPLLQPLSSWRETMSGAILVPHGHICFTSSSLTVWVAQALQWVRSEGIHLRGPVLPPPRVPRRPCPGWHSDEGQQGCWSQRP